MRSRLNSNPANDEESVDGIGCHLAYAQIGKRRASRRLEFPILRRSAAESLDEIGEEVLPQRRADQESCREAVKSPTKQQLAADIKKR